MSTKNPRSSSDAPGALRGPRPADDHPATEEALHDALVREARQAQEAQRAASEPAPGILAFRDIDERALWNPSAMLRRPSWPVRFISRLMFRHVAFEPRRVEEIRDATREHPVVFAMNHHSLLDYLYFNYAFLQFSLPLAYFANKMSLAWARPLWRVVVDGVRRLFGRVGRRLTDVQLLRLGLARGRPAFVFLKRKALWPWASGEAAPNTYLRAVLQAQRARPAGAPSILVLPQLLIWSQEPDRYERRLRSLVFGNPDVPGRARKLISFLLNRRHAFVQLGKPIDVAEFLARQPADLTDGELARKLRFEIHRSLNREERVIKGPILKDAKRIREEILRTREMARDIEALAEELGRSRDQVERQVSRYLREMAADFSIAYIEFMVISLTFILDRLYNEVVPDLDGLERLREAGREAPLILLPSHRSHVDYLVISYLFYANGLIAPHIAAGKNLNFFPIGHIFRRSGAFFIRRSFKGNKPYQLAFRDYLRKLIKEGYWIEFFIEGGRSRTGKTLPPKYGMLRRVVEAIQSGAAPDVYLAPIALGYEQIIEERAYSDELSGTSKKKENITQLLKTTRVLWSRYGRLYVNFGEPISCRAMLDEAGVADLPSSDPRHIHFVQRLAYRVLQGINRVTVVTPSALVAAALLTHPKRGIRRSLLLARVGYFLELAIRKGAPLSKTLSHALRLRRPEIAQALAALDESGLRERALSRGADTPVAVARGAAVAEVIDETLTRFLDRKQIEAHRFEDELIYTPVPSRRVALDFYKNNLVHLVVREAIFAAAARGLARGGRVAAADVHDAALFLSRTFKFEFVYDPERPFDDQYAETLQWARDVGFVERAFVSPQAGEDEGADAPPGEELVLPEAAAETFALFHQILEPWLEAYWALARGLDRHLRQPTPQRELLKRIQKDARIQYQEGDLSCPESANTVTFKNALEAFVQEGLVRRTGHGRETTLSLAPATAEDPQRLAALAESLRTFFTT